MITGESAPKETPALASNRGFRKGTFEKSLLKRGDLGKSHQRVPPSWSRTSDLSWLVGVRRSADGVAIFGEHDECRRSYW
jgi:hypothetical protein